MDLFCTLTLALAMWQGWSSVAQKVEENAISLKDILVPVEETRTGSLMLGVGVNSDAGLTGCVVTRSWYEPSPETGLYYWPFNGPLHQCSESGPMPGAAFDWYGYLPTPAARKPVYRTLAGEDSDWCSRHLGWSDWVSEPWLLAAPILPPPSPLFLRCLSPKRSWYSPVIVAPGPVLDDCGQDYSAMLSHPDERVRYHAALQFGQTDADYAIDALRATLSGDPSAAVREAAARSLAKLGGMGEAPALRTAAHDDGDEDVKRAAGFAVEMIEDRCGMSITHLLSLEKTPLIQNGVN